MIKKGICAEKINRGDLVYITKNGFFKKTTKRKEMLKLMEFFKKNLKRTLESGRRILDIDNIEIARRLNMSRLDVSKIIAGDYRDVTGLQVRAVIGLLITDNILSI
jgi:hypothetical protein